MEKIETITSATPQKAPSYIYAVALSALYVTAFQLIASQEIRMLLSVVFIGVLFISDINTAFFSLMFITCGNEMLKIGSTSISTIFVVLYAFKFIIEAIYKKKIKITTGMLIPAIILLTVNAVQFILGNSNQLSTTVKCVFFFVFMLNLLQKNKNARVYLYKSAFRVIACGINFFGVIAVFINGFPSISERFSFSQEVTINLLAILCAFTIVNLVYSVMIIGADHKVLDLTLILGCAFWGILTQSRSFILAVVIGVLALFLFCPSIKNKGRILLIATVSIIVFSVTILKVPQLKEIFSSALGRIENPSGDDISNGRYSLWQQYIQVMLNNSKYTWFGAGDFAKIGASFDDIVLEAHNLFIEVWVLYGFVGSLLISLMFYEFIKNNIFICRNRHRGVVCFVPLIVMIITLFYSHHFIGGARSIIFLLSFLPITFTKEEMN